jgi:regulator of sirC expression with transglutaminase-like and TPR domain
MFRHPFDQLMELPPEQVRLDCAALHLARDAHPQLDVQRYLEQLDALAEEVAQLRPGLSAPLRFEAMQEVLVRRHGFGVRQAAFDDADSSYLNRVLERKCGLPIALSVVWIEVGRRLKWPVGGVSFPGHFLVRFDDPEHYVIVDPYQEGRTLDLRDLQALREEYVGSAELEPDEIQVVDTRTILIRMLNNLRALYLERRDFARLERVLSRLRAVEPENGQHLQDLAAVHCRQGELNAAYHCLANYLHLLPGAHDAGVVERNLHRLEAALLARN